MNHRVATALKVIGLLLIPSLAACVLIAELVFSTLIPASRQPAVYFDTSEQLLRFDTDLRRDGVYTAGNLARQRGHWRVNEQGWISDIDYRPPAERDLPLIAIIGDSYVEALHVDVDACMAAVLRRRLEGQFDVYSFGVSGAPLSQYLLMSRHVARTYDPDVIVFNVVPNDLAESLKNVDAKDHCLQLASRNDSLLWVPPEPYVPNRLRRALSQSAFVRYLVFNVRVTNIRAIFRSRRRPGAMRDNVDLDFVQRYRPLVTAATERIVRTIRRENADRELIFLMDAPRANIYEGVPVSPAAGWMWETMREACHASGVRFVDLTESFERLYERRGEPFNSPYDYHWNEWGHRAAAGVLVDSLVAFGIADAPAGEAR